MPGFRMERVNSQLQREISHILSSVIKEDRVHDAIITSVDCAKDLKTAKVYYTTLNEKGRQGLAKALEKVSSAVRQALSRNLSLRTVPELRFIFDESEIQAREMDKILDYVTAELQERERAQSQIEEAAGDGEDQTDDDSDGH